MWLKVVSWASIVLNALWLLFAVWALATRLGHALPPTGDAAYVIGFWIGVSIFGLLIVGAPILSIVAVLAGGLRGRMPPPRSVDAVFE